MCWALNCVTYVTVIIHIGTADTRTKFCVHCAWIGCICGGMLKENLLVVKGTRRFGRGACHRRSTRINEDGRLVGAGYVEVVAVTGEATRG